MIRNNLQTGRTGTGDASCKSIHVWTFMFSHDRKLSRNFVARFNRRKQITTITPVMKVAHFTDTFHEINGVALTLQQQIETAMSTQKDMTIVTCGPDKENSRDRQGVKNFQPIGIFELPEYPELKLFYPPLLEMIGRRYRFCFWRTAAR